jgi:protein-S-isoprenylcysteine O-methyltransferase Ste14
MTISSEGRRQSSALSFLIRRIHQDLQFSRIFVCDFFAAAAHAIATICLLVMVRLPQDAVRDMAALAIIYAVLHAIKIVMVIYLERQGGDAREFVGSESLVTTGVYSYSRNPVYVLSIAQSILWSILLLRGASSTSLELAVIATAIMIPIGHFLSIDRLVIPNEEAALKEAHPKAFADYARGVNRWLGWRKAI